MARALSAAMLTAIVEGTVRPAFLFEGVFSGGTLRLWTGVGDLSWNGYTWTGAGNMLSITAIREASSLEAVNFTVGLNGNVSSVLSIALAQVRRGLAGTVWMALFDSAGALVADPFEAFVGRADRPNIVPDPADAVITVAYESRLIAASRTIERRYTHEDQQLRASGDRGFEYVPTLQDAQIPWGRGIQ